MSSYRLPSEVNELASALSSLPGIGPKMANRLSSYLATDGMREVDRLRLALKEMEEGIGICLKTGNITKKGEIDVLFTDPERDRSILLVLESPLDLFQIESSGAYTGLYLVLGGLISPLTGTGPEDLALDKLSKLVESESLDEVILAFSSTVEGEATSLYVTDLLQKLNSKIITSRLARGLPTGASIEFLDSDTLSQALSKRVNIEE